MQEQQKNKVSIELILNRVMVKVDEAIKKTETGIYIPEAAERIPNSGIIVAKGEHCVSSIKEGDHVIFKENSGQRLSYEKEDYLMFNEDAIWGKIPN